jgi:hypothetical protein
MYYAIDNTILYSSIPLKSSNGYSRAIELSEQQIIFYLANPTASISEVLAMELNPPPEPIEPTEPEPTIEERISGIEDLLLEML